MYLLTHLDWSNVTLKNLYWNKKKCINNHSLNINNNRLYKFNVHSHRSIDLLTNKLKRLIELYIYVAKRKIISRG